MTKRVALQMERTASKRLLLDIYENGLPMDLTGASVSFTAKRSRVSLDAMIQKSVGDGIEIVDAQEGKIAIDIAPADTMYSQRDTVLVWDIQVVDQFGHKSIPVKGTLRVNLDVKGEGYFGPSHADHYHH
jgi:hypothetical protein